MYAYNKMYSIPFYKRLPKDLVLMNPNIKKELDYIVGEANTPLKMKRKLEYFESIVKKIEKVI